MDERKEASIGVVVIDKKPLLFGLEIIFERNYILVSELAHHLHIPTSEKLKKTWVLGSSNPMNLHHKNKLRAIFKIIIKINGQ